MPGRAEAPHTPKEVTVQRHVSDERLFHQQVAAGEEVVLVAPCLDLTEVVLRDQLAHRVPEFITNPCTGRSCVGHQCGHSGRNSLPRRWRNSRSMVSDHGNTR